MVERFEPAVRRIAAGSDSALLTVLLAVLIISAFCAPVVSRLVSNYFRQLFRSNREPLAGERTFSERLAVIICLIQTIAFEGLLLFAAMGAHTDSPLPVFSGLAALCALLMLVQLVGYRLVGYAFANAEETHRWQSAFLITQSLLGYLLAVPAFGVLFYPSEFWTFWGISMGFYALCRIPLFISEFRIFKTDKFSLLYFFLYLCTLEIVPLLAIWRLAEFFSTLLT